MKLPERMTKVETKLAMLEKAVYALIVLELGLEGAKQFIL